jgi:uncharacterized repeat protein (TIGR03803 family)
MTRSGTRELSTLRAVPGIRTKNSSPTLNRLMAIIALLTVMMLTGSGLAVGQGEVVLYGFHAGNDGANPVAGVITDGKGHLFGTTSEGGGSSACGHRGGRIIGCGTVLELGPPMIGGHATETILYVFPGGASGSGPFTPLVFDSAGNLYGATSGGGASGFGVVFELSPPQESGPWTAAVLYNFVPSDGPASGLILDAQGNLYGETTGYPNAYGSVYELSPPTVPGGAWTHTLLFAFNGNDGLEPVGGLVSDPHGNLYGTTAGGGTGHGSGCPGSNPCGLVFELVKPALPGAWTEKVLYNFTGLNGDGGTPESGLIIHGGLLYGTTSYGGNDLGDGTVFSLSPPKPGKGWTESILFQFDRSTDGFRPEAGVVFDKAGNLYGTTLFGSFGGAEIFELSPPAGQGDPWTETTLYNFGCGSDGCEPVGNLISIGNWLYGAAEGGTRGDGVVFKLPE